MKDEKINSFGLSILIVSLGSCSFYGILSAYILNVSKTSTIISMILGYLLSLILSIISLGIFSIKPKLTFHNKIKCAYKKLAIPINLLLTICALLIYIFITYRLTTFISSQYLVETPNIYLLLLILFITYYTASKGIETVSRVTILSLLISLIIFISDVFGLIEHIKLDNYLPLITVSTKQIFKSALVFSIYFSAPLLALNSIKKDDLTDKNKFNKFYYIMHFISFLMSFIAITITLGVYGTNLANIFDYPLYTVLKKISLLSFIDSVENISVLLWILSIINASSSILLFIFNNTKEMFNLKKNNKILDLLVMTITFIVPLLFFLDNRYVESFEYVWLPFIISCISLFICLITLIILKTKKTS